MWYVTQFLKIGLVGMIFYWYAIVKIFVTGTKFVKTMAWDSWEKCVLLGLNVGLLCAFVSSADFVRLFLIIGINIGIMASYISMSSSRYQLNKLQ
jgi:hypothetical protein